MTDKSDDLLPCPFCFSDEHLSVIVCGSNVPPHGAPHSVRCTSLDCEGVVGPVKFGRWAAIKAWNTRANVSMEWRADIENAPKCDNNNDSYSIEVLFMHKSLQAIAGPVILEWQEPAFKGDYGGWLDCNGDVIPIDQLIAWFDVPEFTPDLDMLRPSAQGATNHEQ